MDKAIIDEIKNELFSDILPYWQKYSRDLKNPGFYGEIDNENNCNPKCERSIVMTSRFLWTYSAIARVTKNPDFLKMADFAYNIIIAKYFDKKHNGVYWSVLPNGKPKVQKKQIYGEAFCCYGLSEYAAANKELREGGESLPLASAADASSATPSNGEAPVTPPVSEQAMNHALDIYNLLEKYARDPDEGGYVEARARNWKYTKDMILSAKDMNCPKSMNTNLHVMEAYTNLYRTLPVVFPDAKPVRQEVGDSLADLIDVTVKYILQPNAHLGMFFDMNWNLLSKEISYGHDIEASWLLWEAAVELNDTEIQNQIRDVVIKMADVSYEEGFDKENGCMEDCLKENGFRDRTRVWWVQAETMNGMYNAWEMTGDKKYEEICALQWKWVKEKQIDRTGGEWWASVDENGNPILTEDKGGNWKTSYHNGRTCIELLRRTKNI